MSKICVIAGVGPGNGASLSRKFSSAGFRVVMLARNEAYLTELSNTLAAGHGIVCDVRDPDDVRQAFAQVQKEFGLVNVLVYNAGAGEWASPEETSIEGFESSWRTNALGLLVASQQVIPSMKELGYGSIVVIGATASLRGGAHTTAFASAKAAQRSLAQSMARSLGAAGVHVSYVVIDGIIDLERTREHMPDKSDDFFLQPDAIAEAVYQLTEQDSSAWSFEIDLRPYAEKW